MKNCTSSDIKEFRRSVIDSPAIVFRVKEGISDSWNSVDITYKDVFATRAVTNVYSGTKIFAAVQGSTITRPDSLGIKQ